MHGLATLLSDRDSGLFQVPDSMVDQVCESVTNVLLDGLRIAQSRAAEPAAAPAKPAPRSRKTPSKAE
jgi:hypothetical protein